MDDIIKAASKTDKYDDILKYLDDLDGKLSGDGPGGWKQTNEAMSDFSRRYQKYITGADDGMAYEVDGVKFDGFDGINLIDAKANYTNFVNKSGEFYSWFKGKDSLVTQAINQLDAA